MLANLLFAGLVPAGNRVRANLARNLAQELTRERNDVAGVEPAAPKLAVNGPRENRQRAGVRFACHIAER
jgi:hypothetical protein